MTEDFYYMIEDWGTLYLSSNPDGKFTASTRVDQYGSLYWPWTHNDDITKVMIEDRIAPSTCENMFVEMRSLTSIEGLENLDTSSVENMSQMFSICRSLKSLDLSGWDTSNVTDMSCMFYLCQSLTSLDLSGWDTGRVEDMTDMFEGCHSLESVNLSGWDTGSVFAMTFMFAYCESLTEIEGLETLDTSSVTDMLGMFHNCKSLKSLDLSSWDTRSVEDMTDMFLSCPSLETVTTLDERISCEALAARAAALQASIDTLRKEIGASTR